MMDYYCIWEKGYHCYSPSVAKPHMSTMLLQYIILCFLAKVSTYFSTFDYFFFWGLSFFGCLMRWRDWDGLDEEKKARTYIFSELSTPSQLLCRNNPGGNHKKIFKTKCMNSGATEPLLGRILEAKRWEKRVFSEVTEDWQVGLTTALITACHRVPRPFCIRLSVMTSLDREREGGLGGGSRRRFGKDQTVGQRKCWTKKKKSKRSSWKKNNNDKKICLLSDPSVVCRRPETLRYPASLSS